MLVMDDLQRSPTISNFQVNGSISWYPVLHHSLSLFVRCFEFEMLLPPLLPVLLQPTSDESKTLSGRHKWSICEESEAVDTWLCLELYGTCLLLMAIRGRAHWPVNAQRPAKKSSEKAAVSNVGASLKEKDCILDSYTFR
ncbi:unnamed protein product [Periconia digitata]|uniref:Uncharacterized protein n=1 Tax=Periconia digitata TaxID=1303443 RepID=A0A9W4UTI1_9PLEO|nr:unnamed protein product [Periconia digitata]